MKQTLRITATLGAALVLAACGGGAPDEVGPGETALIGTWVAPDAERLDDQLTRSDVTITYEPDGTSDYAATLVFASNGTEERLRMDGDVSWTLDETILTRTLNAMRVESDSGSETGRELAAQFEAIFNVTPPVTLIVQTVDEARLELLDPDTGEITAYERR